MLPVTDCQVRVIEVLEDEFPAKLRGAIVGGVQATVVDELGFDKGPSPFEFLACDSAFRVCPAVYPKVLMKLVIAIVHCLV